MDDELGVEETVRARPGRAEEADEAAAAAAGDLIADRYLLIDVLGAGGMGEVWRARDLESEELLALKLLREDTFTPAERADMRARFRQEARCLSTLEDSRIVKVRDHGEADGVLYIAMELLEGRTLQSFLQDRARMSPSEALTLIAEVAVGMSTAHAKGLVHRDLKPGNIFLVGTEAEGPPSVRILDFGIVKTMDTGAREGAPRTRTGMFIGSPHYMAPEQFEGQPCPATDIYALGIIAWECLVGHRPFEGSTASVAGKHLMQEPPALPLELAIPDDIGNVILEMLEKRPEHRPRSMKHLGRRIRGLLEELEPSHSAAPRWPMTALLTGALFATGGYAASQEVNLAEAARDWAGLRTEPIPKNMVRVEAGSFFMGCVKSSDPSCRGPGGPAEVRAFALDRLEVSAADYAVCVEAGACSSDGMDGRLPRSGLSAEMGEHCTWGRPELSDHPANCVSWHQAHTYCKFREARLPTEKEWERAARGIDARRFPWGHEAPVRRRANLLDRSAYRKYRWREADLDYSDLRPTTGAVGEIPAGAAPSGALDMLGNVWEWTSAEGQDISGDHQAIRGASFMEPPTKARVTSKALKRVDHRGAYLGFRCAKSI